MDLICPKCNSKTIFKRKTVPKYETFNKKVINGRIHEVRTQEGKLNVCCKCWHKF